MANNTPRRNSRDIEELENAFNKLSDSKSPRSRSRSSGSARYANPADNRISTVLIICICLLSVAIIIGGIMIFSMHSDPVIEAPLSIVGVEIKGMTAEEAQAAISQEFDRLYGSSAITVSIDGSAITIPASTSYVQLDAESAVRDAIAAGKKADGYNVSQYLTFDRDGILEVLEETASSINTTLVQTAYEVSGNAPADLLAIDENADLVLKVTMGNPGKKLDLDLLMEMITDAYCTGKSRIDYECAVSEPDALDLLAISQEHCSQAVAAEFEEKTYKVLGGTFGYAFDMDAATQALENAKYGDTFEIPFAWTAPEVTAEELNAQLFRDELSTYTTNQYSDWNRCENLRLACEAVNGLILYPGDVFSYNGTLGERTEEKGYRPGASYVGGETVMDIGGGICQVSSTLYYCTVLADLEIVERDCHTYASSYTPLSTDATVFWGGIDYKFKNNSTYPIRIEAESDGGKVTVRLIGTETKDYYVKFESVHLDTYPFDVVYEEMSADNPKGYKDGQVITSPYTGYKSEGWIVRYDKQTDKEIDREKISTDKYHTRDKVVVKIVEEEEENPTEPDPTEPEPTEPTPTEPTPTEPEPTQPQPTEPEPTDPPADSGNQGGGNYSSGPIEMPMIPG